MSQSAIQPTAVLVRVTKNSQCPNNPYSVISTPSHCFIHLNNSMFTIGRDRLGCQYIFDTLDVSRRHVTFHYEHGNWKITDLSSNGTWLSFEDSQELKLEKNVPTLLKNMNIITLKPFPEIRYVFIENILPSDLLFSVCGSLTLSELSKSLSNKGRGGEKRHLSDSGSGIPAKRPCKEISDEHRKELAIIKEQARLINELKRKLNAQSKLFNLENHTCSICLQVLIRPTTLVPCQHVFCSKCISDFRKHVCSQKSILLCPLCRVPPSFYFVNKSYEMTIELGLQASLSDRELLDRKSIEIEYLEQERLIPNIYKTVQSQFCLPPVCLTESNEIQEIEDVEDFFDTLYPDAVDDSDAESDGTNSSEELDELLLENYQDIFDTSDQTLFVTSSF